MKDVLWHTVVENDVQFVEGVRITMLTWLLPWSLIVLELETFILDQGIHVVHNVPTHMSFLSSI